MRYAHLSRSFLWFVLFGALAVMSCQQANTATASAPTKDNNGKIPVTTSSEEARKEYLAGRDLQEKLRITDSIAHFDKAISLDPNFALAELNRANVSPTAKEFFEHLKKAVALAAALRLGLGPLGRLDRHDKDDHAGDGAEQPGHAGADGPAVEATVVASGPWWIAHGSSTVDGWSDAFSAADPGRF